MRLRNVYVVGTFDRQQDWDDLVSRLAWYFTPYLDRIGYIHLCASPEQIAAARLVGPLDPRIESLLPALKKKIKTVSRETLDNQLKRVDSSFHLFLLADSKLESSYRTLIGRFRPKGRFYAVDPQKDRMEGSFYLWAGVNAFTNAKEDASAYHEKFQEMVKDIGQYDKAYVFGTGPSLSDFVEGHDFSDGLTIIANSIVLNNDLLDRLKPKIIVAADPIFHAGCSSYAAAFRTALEAALDKTGAWFLCPLRDVKIYETYLPARLQNRILGVPFDAKGPAPTDLAETYALKPYPNILTLMLLPLASTFARSVHIVGCDGRKVTEDGSFWTHDKKAQFNDEMDNIKQVHPGFFAIDYNNYYFDHARDLEGVLLALEEAGRTVVTETLSFIPALNTRERKGLRDASVATNRPHDPETLVILDPDARGEWGHFLAYDRRLGQAAADRGLDFSIVGRTDLAQTSKPDIARSLINVFTRHSWDIGNKWPHKKPANLTAFAFEIDEALQQLEQETPDSDILIFMYCGAVEVVDLLEHVLIYHPRVRAVINLFWSYNFDVENPAYREQWRPLLTRVLSRPGPVQITHSTPQIAAEFKEAWNLDVPVLPHPSTTFSDDVASDLAVRPAQARPSKARPRILFPVGARYEKGYMLAVEACAALSETGEFDLCLRTRLEAADEKMCAAVAALDPAKVTLEDRDFGEDDFVDWLASADVIVVPYLPEAFSNRTSGMLVDAMLLGVPVVVVKQTWLADEVTQTGAGFAVEPTSEDLAQGIQTVLANYSRYTAATRAAAEQYLKTSSWRVMVDEVLKINHLFAAEPNVLEDDLRDKSQGELEEIYDKALGLLPSRAPIYLPTEKIPLIDKILGVEHVRKIYQEDLDAVYRPRMQALREQYKGRKRCFLIGNGPSLNKTDLEALKDEVTFAVNGFFLKAEDLDWAPTFYCVEDHLVAEDRAAWINEFNGPIKFFPAYLGYMFPPADDTIFYNHRPRVSYPHGFDFSTEADKITYTGCTVTFSLMQLAAYLGFEEIYLIGVDASYDIPADAQEGKDYGVGVLDMQSDDPNHFNPDYFGKGFRWHDPQVNKMVEAYGEARQTLEGTGQTIYNATIGGKLEVFERRNFNDIFPQARAPETVERDSLAKLVMKNQPGAVSYLPRMLVLDMTSMGSLSATGAIKVSLFQDWPDDRLLQVSSPTESTLSPTLSLVRRAAGEGYSETALSEAAVRDAIAEFDPEVILYRPVADRPLLHNFAMSLIKESKLPLVTWIMDDWPTRLKTTDPDLFAKVDPELRDLLKRADLNLSICDAMSEAFGARYDVSFKAYANGVDPDLWPVRVPHRAGPVLVRYAGGLAQDMNAASVQRVARAIEELADDGLDIRLEINTQPWWVKQSGDMFDGLKATTLTVENRPFADYARWLQEADILLIAYNFDETSLRYVRYSMANKMPECLVSGAALLVHGPREVATVDYIAGNEVGQIADTESLEGVKAALRRLCDPAIRQQLAGKARTLAVQNHSLPKLATRLAADIDDLSQHPRQASAAFDYVLFNKRNAAVYDLSSADELRLGLDPDARGMIIYDDPIAVLAAALAEKADPGEALAIWEEQAEIGLALFRKARRRLSIIARSRMAIAPAAYRVMLEDLLSDRTWPRALRGKIIPQDLLCIAIARYYLDQSPSARLLLAELQASALQPDGVPAQEAMDLPAVLAAYHAIVGFQQTATEQSSALIALTDRAAGLEKELGNQRAGAEKAQADLSQMRAREQTLGKEVTLRNEQITQLQATVETYFKEAEMLRAELDRIYRSKSWRVTEPLRGMRRAVQPGQISR